jgi:hypothetical protein
MLTNRLETYFRATWKYSRAANIKMKEVPEAFPQDIVEMLIREGCVVGKLW